MVSSHEGDNRCICELQCKKYSGEAGHHDNNTMPSNINALNELNDGTECTHWNFVPETNTTNNRCELIDTQGPHYFDSTSISEIIPSVDNGASSGKVNIPPQCGTDNQLLSYTDGGDVLDIESYALTSCDCQLQCDESTDCGFWNYKKPTHTCYIRPIETSGSTNIDDDNMYRSGYKTVPTTTTA